MITKIRLKILAVNYLLYRVYEKQLKRTEEIIMAIFKCKMCGGTIEFNQGDTVGVCDSCGTKQTLPNVNDDAISSLYNRANTLRIKSEFDRAEELYNKIIASDETQAEAYWGIILCKFGIEYVEDPKTFKRVPTCHRTSFDAITADEDFKLAVKYGDAEQKKLYRDEAKAIDAIQKDILNIAKNENPFDIFICYKETDESGKRTQDSVIANEIYHQLTQEGFKVFYAAITLEDKLGQEYEPYIFAALNSAKVMLVIGSRPEYFTAVWVKNEWSRFLKLMKKDRSKLLIPCYKDMDAYELPDDFAHLQAQDMSKIGFINDIVRGIKKVVDNDSSAPKKSVVKETVVMQNENGNVRALLDRGFMALEDGEWDKADGFFEQALNFDAKIAEAYLGKLMAELRVHRKEKLRKCEEPFYNSNNYQKAVRFGDDKLIADLEGYIKHINERNENNRLTETYTSAINAMNSAKTEDYFKAAARAFQSISDFKDSKEKAKECLEKAEAARKDAIFADGREKMYVESISSYEGAIKLFESVSGWRDADKQMAVCKQKIEQLKIKEEEDRLEAERKAEKRRIEKEKTKKKYIRIAKIGGPILAVVIVFIIILNTVIIPKQEYSLLVAQYGKESADKLVKIDVGDTYTFGTYEQDNNFSNGKEAIEWIVLAKEEDKLLLISDKALDCQPYNESWSDVTWETCSLRKWLNQDFLDVAFSESEKDKISTVAVPATNNQKYHTNAGNSTRDKVFILNIDEAKKYFETDESRRCAPTDYAVAQGASMDNFYTTYGQEATTCWLLRSPGESQEKATSVTFAGSIAFSGNSGVSDDGVRPAIWIDLGV